MAGSSNCAVEEFNISEKETLLFNVQVSYLVLTQPNAVESIFKAKLLVKLTVENVESDLGKFLLSDEFSPGLHVLNMTENSKIEEVSQYGNDREEIVFIYCLVGEFYERCELQKFPFDKQDLSILLTLNHDVCRSDDQKRYELSGYSCQKMRNKDKSNSFNYKAILFNNSDTRDGGIGRILNTAFNETDIWVLEDEIRAKFYLSHPSNSASNLQYPIMELRVHAARRPHSYFYGIILPLGFLTAISWSNWIIPHEDFVDRCTINLTLLLTAVAFKFIVSQSVPPVSYQTTLDKYILTCFFLLVFMILENYIVAFFETETVDHVFLVCMLAFWGCYNLWVIWKFSTYCASIKTIKEFRHSSDDSSAKSKYKVVEENLISVSGKEDQMWSS